MNERELECYIDDLRERITARMGAVDPFLEPQILTTAKQMKLMDKILDEIFTGNLLQDVEGRGGAIKKDVNPLLPMYDKMHRSVTADLAALGLNYNTTVKNVMGEIQTGKGERDGLSSLLASVSKDVVDLD